MIKLYKTIRDQKKQIESLRNTVIRLSNENADLEYEKRFLHAQSVELQKRLNRLTTPRVVSK